MLRSSIISKVRTERSLCHNYGLFSPLYSEVHSCIYFKTKNFRNRSNFNGNGNGLKSFFIPENLEYETHKLKKFSSIFEESKWNGIVTCCLSFSFAALPLYLYLSLVISCLLYEYSNCL